MKRILLAIVLLCVVSRLLNAQSEPSLVAQWNNAILLAAFESGYNSLILARAIAIVHNAMFNAWAAYDSKAISDPATGFCRQPKPKRTLANKETAISYAAYFVLEELLPGQIAIFDQLMEALGYETQNLPNDLDSAPRIGARAAEELLKVRRKDRSNQLGNLNPSGVPYSEPILLPGYKPYKYINTVDKLNDINYWQPLRNPDGSAQVYVIPHWGDLVPFGFSSGSKFTPKEKPARTYKNYAAFVAQAKQIYDISNSLTPKQELIAFYWDGQVVPAASPWHGIAAEIAIRDNYSLDDEVKLFFATSNVLHDAIIASWNTKRLYNAVRPITVIRKLFDPTWDSLIPTPPHPDFTSGHAVLASSAAVMFKEFTGSDYYGGSYQDPDTGITLSWETFEDTVTEAGLARMYAGIHTEKAVLAGQEQGRNVGKAVWKKIKRLIGRR